MNYLALTIGPISETISYAKKTRELWVGSYVFSYFMKSLIGKLVDDEITFIIPFVQDSEINTLDEHLEVGVFHDRFIATSTLDKETLHQKVEDRIAETIDELSKLIDSKHPPYEALKAYLQYHFIISTKEELLQTTDKENIVFAIDAILDAMELQYNFSFDNHADIYNHKEKTITDKINPIAKLQYEASRLKKKTELPHLTFKSIPEIALASILESHQFKEFDYISFKEEDELERYEAFYQEFEPEESFKPHHKYYAVISADGDKMGSTIRQIYSKNPDEINTLSKNIYRYITEENENDPALVTLFEEIGGMLIYAGGDDLLGFAPIFGKNGETIFDLLEKLPRRFQRYLGNEVSLSFGVSIHYYKSPMIHAIRQANDLLYRAKDHNTQEQSGSVAIALTKHSGQSFEATFFHHGKLYETYKQLFTDELNGTLTLPHSIHYSLKLLEPLMIPLFDKEDTARIDALFDNLIKDDSQTQQAHTSLDSLKAYIKSFRPSTKEAFQKLITQLAIIKFLRGDR